MINIISNRHLNILISILVIGAMLIFHRLVFYGNISLIIILITFYISSNPLKVLVLDSKLLLALFFFLACVFYYSTRIDQLTFDFLDYDSFEPDFNILFKFLFCLFAFYRGTIYGYKKEHIFKIAKYVCFIYILLFFANATLNYSEIRNGNNLWIGTLVVTLAPISSLVFYKSKNFLLGKLWLLFCAFFLLAVSSRAAGISMLALILIFHFFPCLIKKKITFYSFFPLLFVSFFALMYFYVNSEGVGFINFLNEISLTVFKKSIFSGRHFMWRELFNNISDKIWFGFGAFQNSSYFLSNIKFLRNLSSHNTYLEIMLRGGITGLFLLVSTLFFVWRCFYTKHASLYTKLGASSMICLIVNCFSIELMITQNIICNIIIWFFWGACAGKNLFYVANTEKSIS